MGIPDDVVLDGYTLIEQHAIDHEFLLRGSPLGTETPFLFALTIAGVLGDSRPGGCDPGAFQAVVDALRAMAAVR